MGYFTWTLANRQVEKTAWGYKASCKLHYGGYGAIICPDDTAIQEFCYDGYGKFNGHDIFDLVADWNKDSIVCLVVSGATKNSWFQSKIEPVAFAWAKGMPLEEAVHTIGDDFWGNNPQEYKRIIGIWLNSLGDKLPYPIKIVDTKKRFKRYADLPASIETQ